MAFPVLTPEELNYYASLNLADPDDDALQQFLEQGSPSALPQSGNATGKPPVHAASSVIMPPPSAPTSRSSSISAAAEASPDAASPHRLSTSPCPNDFAILAKRPKSARLSASYGAFSKNRRATSNTTRCGVTDVLEKADLVGGISGMADAALQTRIVELPGRQLTSVESLQCFLNATHLYLQHNAIRSLDGLELLLQLQVLVAPHNALFSVEPLRNLDQLFYLDLSFNELASLSTLLKDELPCASLRYLNLKGNPFQIHEAGTSAGGNVEGTQVLSGLEDSANHDNYVSVVRASCLQLEYLDDVRLTSDTDETSEPLESTAIEKEEDAEAQEKETTTRSAAMTSGIGSSSSRRVQELVEAARLAARAEHTSYDIVNAAPPAESLHNPNTRVENGDSASYMFNSSRQELQQPTLVVRSSFKSKHATPLEQEEERLVRQLLLLRKSNSADTIAVDRKNSPYTLQHSANGMDAATPAAAENDTLDERSSAADALLLFQGLQYTQEVSQARQQRDVAAHWDDVSRVLQTAQGLQQDRRRRMHERLQEDTPSYAETLQLLQKESYTHDLDRYRHKESQALPTKQPLPLPPPPQQQQRERDPASTPTPAVSVKRVSQANPSKPTCRTGSKTTATKSKKNSITKDEEIDLRHVPVPLPPRK